MLLQVLESAWSTLLEGLKRAKNLDDVIRTHDAYLQDILERALLAPHHENLNTQVSIALNLSHFVVICFVVSDIRFSAYCNQFFDSAAWSRR